MSEADAARLRQLILDEDWSSVDLAQQLGNAATSVAAELLQHENEEVRFLAIRAVVEGGGSDAAGYLLSVLDDEDEQIRAVASQGLMRYPPDGHIAEAWSAWRSVEDPAIRYNIGLSLGLTSEDTTSELRKALESLPLEESQITADGLIGALARRGDPYGAVRLGDILDQASGPRAAGALQVFHFAKNANLLKLLRPLLDRYEVAVDLSSHAHTLHRRTCDLAIDELLELAPGALGFPKQSDSTYTEEQIERARRYLDGLPNPG